MAKKTDHQLFFFGREIMFYKNSKNLQAYKKQKLLNFFILKKFQIELNLQNIIS